MKGLLFLLFFAIFAIISIVIPTPIFPGNWFCFLIGQNIQNYTTFLSALFNGLFYGLVIYLVFVIMARKVNF